MDTRKSGNEILSVGIDIGTTTTQVAFSLYRLTNQAGMFSVPNFVIKDKELLYKSPSEETPIEGDLLKGEDLEAIVMQAYTQAGLKPQEVGTGAVIVTGEAAKRKNARIASEKLASFAGDFVVTTAGPDMEAMIAGQGSGTAKWSEKEGLPAVNIDIGGGTCSLALYENGQCIQLGSFDIGGRSLQEKDGNISGSSLKIQKMAQTLDLSLALGRKAEQQLFSKLADSCTQILEAALGLCEASALYPMMATEGSSEWKPVKPYAVSFSGGVADCIYAPPSEFFKYHDMGVALGKSIRRSRIMSSFKILEAQETIHATVLGAGSYTLSVSGSTVSYTKELFPIRNLPVLKLTPDEEAGLLAGSIKAVDQRISWFLEQVDSDNFALAMTGCHNPSFDLIDKLAQSLAKSGAMALSSPFVLLIQHDMAKALGQALKLLVGDRDLICLDGILVNTLNYIDIGKPFMSDQVVPLVVKTLIYSGELKGQKDEILEMNNNV